MKMSRNEIFDKLKEIIVSADETIPQRFPELTEQTRVLEDLGFTSIGMLFMAVSVEEVFQIKLDNINIWSLHVIGDVISMIEGKLS